eukprot:6188321-Pleurochrysis_carterae.AAC.1
MHAPMRTCTHARQNGCAYAHAHARRARLHGVSRALEYAGHDAATRTQARARACDAAHLPLCG